VTIYRNTGGRFAAPPQTEAVPVGTGTLAFDSCMSGTFAYTLDDGRTGEIPLRTAVPMMYCSEIGTPDALAGQFVPPGPFGRGGAWYDPTTAGQGALVSVDYFGAVFVGDAVWDAEASARAQVTSIGLLSGGVSRGELESAGATEVFENPLELLTQLEHSRIAALTALR